MSELRNFSSAFSLEGKTALVTGGSRGLGLHMATAFLLQGAAHVIVTARKREGDVGIDQAVEKLNKLPGIKGKASGLAGNVGDSKEIERVAKEIGTALGGKGLDILVCNAGTSWGSPFEEAPSESSKKILDLNVRGVFELVQKTLPLLKKNATPEDPSRVIVVSSVAGTQVPHIGQNGTIMYSVSKAAVSHMARNLAVELGTRNITANAISPGFFPSKLASGLIDILGGEEELSKDNPLGRLGEPEDVAGVAVFLCSPAGKYVNGVDIAVDGGGRLSPGRLSRL